MVKRTLPPAAAPLNMGAIISSLRGIRNGPKAVERFRSELKDFYNINNCYLLSSGKAALFVILKALHDMHPDRNEVVIPAFTCYSVPSAIVKGGFRIRLCDIDRETLDFDYERLAEICAGDTKRILAIVPMHLYGIPPDIARIRGIVRDKSITIIEDAAQGMGGTWQGKKNGSVGDVGFFSLSRGKAFSTVEGGVVLTEREDIASALEGHVRTLPEYPLKDILVMFFNSVLMIVFMHPALFWFPRLLPFLKVGETIYRTDFPVRKMSGFQGGLSKGWQKKLACFNIIRSTNAQYWVRFFHWLSNNMPLVADQGTCSGVEEAVFSINTKQFIRDCIRFPLKINDSLLRDKILQTSEMAGAGIMPSYPDSIDGIRELEHHFPGQSCPAAKEVAEKLVTLPVHLYVKESDRNKICRLFIDSLNE